ncbi:MAG: amidase [Actinomycetota bacterium]|nr:amidase [Actinomycetota bacterium]
MTIARARQLLDSGRRTAVQLTEACLERIEQTEPALKAWVTIDVEGALETARRIDTEGVANKGLLSGIPVSVKDIFDVEGLPTTASSRVLEGNIASTDADVVRTIKDQGAVILGKTNTHEFAYGYVTPPTSNPWDLGRIPGGSSGGAAVSVAVGAALGAIGSDTGGSIRVPAALNGVTGLLPRHGVLSLKGVIPLAPSLDAVGTIAQDAQDVAFMWAALSGETAIIDAPKFSIGIPDQTVFGEVDDEVLEAFDRAVTSISALADSTSHIKLPPFEDFNLPRGAIIMPESLDAHRSKGWWPAKKDLYSEELQTYFEFAESFMTGEMAESGQEFARTLVDQFLSGMESVDVAVTPSAPCGAPTHEEAAKVEPMSPRRPVALKLMRLPGPVNMAGLAAISLPCGFTARGLPIGLQIIGRDERLLIAIADAYQKQTEWHKTKPTI